MSGEGSAKLFNELAFHVLSYIEVMPGVTELDFEERHGVSSADIGAWDAANMPYRLPAELAATVPWVYSHAEEGAAPQAVITNLPCTLGAKAYPLFYLRGRVPTAALVVGGQ